MQQTRYATKQAMSKAVPLLLAVGLVMLGCGDNPVTVDGDRDTTTTSITNPPPSDFDARGTVSGRVIDRVTSEPIQGADVAIDAAGEERTATTGEDGSFRLTGVPANTSDRDDAAGSGTYNVHVTPNDDRYREAYTAEVTLVYGADDGGSGSANNLGASVTFPLSKVTGSVEGTLVSEAGVPVSEAQVQLYQDLDLRFNDEGGSLESDFVKVTADTTGEDGGFAFNRVEEASSYRLKAKVGDEPVFPEGASGIEVGQLPPSSEGDTEARLEEVTVPNGALPALAGTLDPAIGTDYDTTEPEWTLTFNRPVAGVTPGAVESEISINASSITTKAVGAGGEVEIEADTTQAASGAVASVSWSVAEPIGDGIEFEVGYGDLFDAVVGARYGAPVSSVNGTEVSNLPFALAYSIGANENAPAVPSFELADVYLDLPGFFGADYSSIQPQPVVNIEVDDSQAPVREYEIFVRTEHMRETQPAGDQFGQLETGSGNPLTIPADAAEFGEISNQAFLVNCITISTQEGVSPECPYPFAGPDGSYGPIELKIRAVSINGVRSDFSDVVEVGDSVSTPIGGVQGQPGDNQATFTTPEPLAESTVEAGNLTLETAAGNDRSDDIESVEIANEPALDFNAPEDPGAEVTVTLSSGEQFNTGDRLIVSDSVEDLAGNGFDQNNNTVEFQSGGAVVLGDGQEEEPEVDLENVLGEPIE